MMISRISDGSYQAARNRAALVDRSGRGRIVVKGGDRASYLQGLLTNDVAALESGQGCYAAYLTPQGRMIADMWVYELGDLILLGLAGDMKDAVLARFDQLIFTEDVQLGDVTDTFAQVAVVGPEAARVIAGVLDVRESDVAALPEHGNLRAPMAGHAIVSRITDTGEPGFDVYIEPAQASRLTKALEGLGVVELDADAAEAIRIEAGVPLFHRDMDEETIPLEAGLESRAISFTKGCYVGQEVIVRVLHRGHGRVARRLVGLIMTNDVVPPRGAAIRVQDREIGGVTSSVLSPALGHPIALGYVHRDFIEPGTVVAVDGARATVAALPFVPRPISPA